MRLSGDVDQAESTQDRVPLSVNQELVCQFDSGGDGGPLGPRYHLVDGWRVTGRVDIPALRDALDALVVRHEALRSQVVKDADGSPYQVVLPPGPADLTVVDLEGRDATAREHAAQAFVGEAEMGTISAREVPVIRCLLGRFGEKDSALVLMTHHMMTDGWSMQVIMRDLATLYAARRGRDDLALPDPRQYRDYVAGERAAENDEALKSSLEYWQDRLRDGRIVTVRTDWPRSAGRAQATGVHRFMIGPDVVLPAVSMAREMRGSPFMVLMAAFNVLGRRTTGTGDIVVPTFTPGRNDEMFRDTVGPFFNFLPIRTDARDCGTFADVLKRTRSACMGAYSHDVSRALLVAPEIIGPALEDQQATCVFQQLSGRFIKDGETIGDLTYSWIPKPLGSAGLSSEIPDGLLWTLDVDPKHGVHGTIAYKANLFEADRVSAIAADYQRILAAGVAEPGVELKRLESVASGSLSVI